MSSVDEIRTHAFQLPMHERATLARDLLLSLEVEVDTEDIDSIWGEEIDARSAAVAAGEVSLSDWRDAISRVRQALSQRSIP